ncbi:polysaccharide lyase family 7 protein [Pseudoalteromonas sp. MMG010]|uniref:polysaccharide lyase family 7 protein n=1 Tax=Pseudoalteromonas sp. MMG010 TaxID=2822685 RepID=UPI001B39E079|nr:polysaccharide lyase family 7 protein [Pseudoalteromonas sp. MMG010]MBQ4832053.1 polysaccharide lyase family 7 protein [Pseudoalteromonas sp. MMG010]
MKLSNQLPFYALCVSSIMLTGCINSTKNNAAEGVILPAQKFDLSQWQINTPTDIDNDGVVDEIRLKELQSYYHPDYFYINDEGNMVFAAPNKAITSVNSTNTRSELHNMLGGELAQEKDFSNNFALKNNRRAEQFAQIGGNLKATLSVNHVSKRAKYAEKPTAYSVVVGQVHAIQDPARQAEGEGYGWGNEPLKIYFKKWPNHQYGSVFWNYERNLEKDNPNRIDISYPVWGNDWLDKSEPAKKGIALDEPFSYEVNVVDNTMYLTFTNERHGTMKYEINLANNIDAFGVQDTLDHPKGYQGEGHFFKAGAYNQCSTADKPSFRYPACPGTGDWKTDKLNGDYTQVTFMALTTTSGYLPDNE